MSLEPTSILSPAALHALKVIRAARALPQTSGTLALEKRTLNQLRLPDLSDVALRLQADDEEDGL